MTLTIKSRQATIDGIERIGVEFNEDGLGAVLLMEASDPRLENKKFGVTVNESSAALLCNFLEVAQMESPEELAIADALGIPSIDDIFHMVVCKDASLVCYSKKYYFS